MCSSDLIDLGERTIDERIEHMFISRSASDRFKVYSDQQLATFRQIVPSLVSLVLYLCSENAEMFDVAGGKHSLQRPKPTKTKRGFDFTRQIIRRSGMSLIGWVPRCGVNGPCRKREIQATEPMRSRGHTSGGPTGIHTGWGNCISLKPGVSS